MHLELREHQSKCIQMIRDVWHGSQWILVYGSTGFGKTLIAGKIADNLVRKDLKVLFLAPFSTLVYQTAERFYEYGLAESGYIKAEMPVNPFANLQVGTHQSFAARNGEFKDYDLVFVDEAHIRNAHIEAQREKIKGTRTKVIGLTGSPFAKFLADLYDVMVKPTTLVEMIEKGYSTPVRYYAPSCPDLSGVKTSRRDGQLEFNEDQLAEIMCGAKLVGDVVANWIEHSEVHKFTIAFCVNIAHANELANRFEACGVKVGVVTGFTKTDERKQIFQDYERGIIQVLLNVGVLVAGFDSVVWEIIGACPMASIMKYIQTGGRGVRLAPGKEYLNYFDHAGNYYRHGPFEECGIDSLDEIIPKKESKSERLKKQKEELERKQKTCPKCKAIKETGGPCPRCGFSPRAGEDVDTDTTRQIELIDEELKKAAGPTQEDKQNFYSELLCHCREKGWSEGWAAHKFKHKFKEWPKGLRSNSRPVSPETASYIKYLNIHNAKSRKKNDNNMGSGKG